MSKKKIVGKFNSSFEKIHFYDIVDNYKHYTILKKQGSDKFYAWDNKEKMLSDDLHIICIPEEKLLYEYILDNAYGWHKGEVFFWADSRFVTEYGLPHYNDLIEIYKKLLLLRRNAIEVDNELLEIRRTENIFIYFKCLIYSRRFKRRQRRAEKELGKEFGLIW